MTNWWIQRGPSQKECTQGSLFIDGAWECFTLEDVVREPDTEWRYGLHPSQYGAAVAKWKIHGKTAIPSGRYRLSLEDSPRFGPDTITINNVPDYDKIRMHGGNDAEDTDGCPLVGDTLDWDHERISGASRGVLDRLKAKLRASLSAGEEAWIDITNT